MARVNPVYKPADYPADLDEVTKAELAAFFAYLFPDNPAPEIDAAHTGLAVTAYNPTLALNLAKMSGFIVRDLGWCQNQELHEFAVQTVNLHFKCNFTLRARAARAQSLGIDASVLAVIPAWAESNVLSGDQRLIVEYSYAVVSGTVADDLFKRMVTAYGEKAVIECTAAIAWWALWAMIINALCPA